MSSLHAWVFNSSWFHLALHLLPMFTFLLMSAPSLGFEEACKVPRVLWVCSWKAEPQTRFFLCFSNSTCFWFCPLSRGLWRHLNFSEKPCDLLSPCSVEMEPRSRAHKQQWVGPGWNLYTSLESGLLFPQVWLRGKESPDPFHHLKALLSSESGQHGAPPGEIETALKNRLCFFLRRIAWPPVLFARMHKAGLSMPLAISCPIVFNRWKPLQRC